MKLHKRLLGLNTWLFLVKIKKLLKLGPLPGFYTKKNKTKTCDPNFNGSERIGYEFSLNE